MVEQIDKKALKEARKEAKGEARQAKAQARDEKTAELKAKLTEQTAPLRAALPAGALFTGKSHDPGRNAVVTLYPDRVERVKEKAIGSWSKANQDHEVTPVKSISSVQATKDGFRTKVTVYATGNEIVFRFDHQQAAAFRDALMPLVLGGAAPPPPAAPVAPAGASPADQVRELAALRDEGLLSNEEFDAKRRELLGL